MADSKKMNKKPLDLFEANVYCPALTCVMQVKRANRPGSSGSPLPPWDPLLPGVFFRSAFSLLLQMLDRNMPGLHGRQIDDGKCMRRGAKQRSRVQNQRVTDPVLLGDVRMPVANQVPLIRAHRLVE